MIARLKRHLTLSNFLNAAMVVVFALFIIQRTPNAYKMFQSQGKLAPAAQVSGLRGSAFSLPLAGKHAVIFWATWCAPCKVELARINKMVIDKKLKPDSILAISIGEDPRLVASTIAERDYKFDIAVDPTAVAAAAYNVTATPTILLVDENAKISWMTSGLSPTLEMRLSSFFN